MKQTKAEAEFERFLTESARVIMKLSRSIKNSCKSLSKFDIKKASLKKGKVIRLPLDNRRFRLGAGSAILLVFIAMYIFFAGTAYAIKVNGVEIGKVRKLKTVTEVMTQLKAQYKTEINTEVGFLGNITFDRTRASGKEVLNEKALLDKLKNNLKYGVQSYSIYANGNLVAAVPSKETAQKVLKDIQTYFLKGMDTSKVKEVTFAEKVEIKQEYNEVGKIMEHEEAAAFLLRGTDEVKVHKIESGETFWTISRKYKMSMDALTKANPGVNPEKVQIGQKVNLIVPKPLLSVKTVETATFVEQITFEQKVEFSDALFKTETNVKVKGSEGQKQITADIVKINGEEKSRNILAEKQIAAPKTQIIIKGTKEPPARRGTGVFSMPTRGSLSSKYGLRWGRRHQGIDIAAPIGTPVRASDGGLVVYVGWEGGYGKFVKVDHGNGYVTCYGHLSKYYVKVGQKVYKGQKIAAVGNTGRSTGPHLHFEIRKNGQAKNPLSFLK